MSTKKESKLNQLLQNIPNGIVFLSSWLLEKGYSHNLQQKYVRSKWLTPIGKGAYIRTGQKATIFGAIFSLQKQANKNIHIGAASALALHGYSHYVEINQFKIQIIAPQGFKLPLWFSNHTWNNPYVLKRTNILPSNIELLPFEINNLDISISSPGRAIIECLDLAPENFDLEEAWFIMESLNTLIPSQVQNLLENTNSIKAKRLFLFMAEKAKHTWFQRIDISKINLGTGKRSIVKNGVFNKKYQITIPQSIV